MENSIEKLRDYLLGANMDIFDIIDKAIEVAACDRPYDFNLKRHQIVDKLFSCNLVKGLGCDESNKTALPESCGSNGSAEKKPMIIKLRVKRQTDLLSPALDKVALLGNNRDHPTKVEEKSNNDPIQNSNAKTESKSNVKTEALRLEMAKRKFRERYQEIEDDKKRRKIQVLELRDLPKQSLVQRKNQLTRPGRCSMGRC